MEEIRYPFEVQFILGNLEEDVPENLKKELLKIGDSLDIFQLEDSAKIHIHTASPQKVQEICQPFGEISDWSVEDMAVQVKAGQKKRYGLVVDEGADLPPWLVEQYGIKTVPFSYYFTEKELSGSFYQKLRAAKQLPTTSQPSPADFMEAYQAALETADQVIAITITSKLSGTFSSAKQGRELLESAEGIHIIDSLNVTVGEALFVLKCCQLIEESKEIEQIKEDLEDFRDQIKVYAVLGNLKYIQAGGRISENRILAGFIGKAINFLGKLGIRPLLVLKDGKVKVGGVKFFAFDLASLLAKQVKKTSPSGKIMVAISHADNITGAEKLKEKIIKEMPQAEILFISEIGLALVCHTGPGALAVAFHLAI